MIPDMKKMAAIDTITQRRMGLIVILDGTGNSTQRPFSWRFSLRILPMKSYGRFKTS
ncbi:hypothetical protein HanIR_Chr08g0383481 [Helianthus annuus]|nr:hypothetical protein HanIR_Chr08g0383481 [Helianthus annuus]